MKSRKTWIGAALVLIVIAVILFAAFRPKDTTQYFTEPTTKGNISDVVQATGTINAVTTVQVGSQVSGTIATLYADFNSHVKKGQVVARIDPSLFEGALIQAQADLQNAEANVAAAKANAAKAQATAEQALEQYQRSKTLAAQGVESQQQLELDQAASDADAADAKSMQAMIGQANAQVALKKAAVTVAQTNLDHCTITAPVDGTVISRNVDVGQTVAASLQAPVLFQIAQDLTKMQVYINVDESDVGQIHPGQDASFTVDAFPKETFHGTVSQIRLNATAVQNVVTYNALLDFDNPQMKLFPGMTAYVDIPVANADQVLRVPNGALRYKPGLTQAEVQAAYAAVGMEAPKARAQTASDTSGAGGGIAAQMGGGGGQQGGNGGQGGGTMHSSNRAILWKLVQGKKLEPVQIMVGITDHTQTEVAKILHGTLNPGDAVITGSTTKSTQAGLSTPGGMGQPVRGR